MVIFDVGAGHGDEAQMASILGHEVYAFEPHPHLAKKLRSKLKNVNIIEAACGKNDGRAKLYFHNGDSLDGSSIIKEKNNVDKDRFERVDTVNLGSFIKKLGKFVDILKIDAEGAEWIILKTILNEGVEKQIGKIYYEQHSRKISDKGWNDAGDVIKSEYAKRGVQLYQWN